MLAFVALVAAASSPAVSPAPEPFAACAAPPPGMACVPGGPAVVGSDDGPVVERPRRTVEISTFYMDVHEVTNGEYQACVAAGSCAPLDIPECEDHGALRRRRPTRRAPRLGTRAEVLHLQQQELMKRKGYISLKQLAFARNKTDDVDLTITGLAAAPH